MGAFLYYIPNCKRSETTDLDYLRSLGLGYAFDRQPTARECNCGPDSGHGFTIADPRRFLRGDVAVKAFAPQRWEAKHQRWRRMPNSQVWVGWYTHEDSPDPGSLIRAETTPRNVPVKCVDGRDWLVPVARRLVMADEETPAMSCALPRAIGYDDETGEWRRKDVIPRYDHLWQIAQGWFDFRRALVMQDNKDDFLETASQTADEHGLTWSFQGMMQAVVDVLATNYYVSIIEVDALRIIDDRRQWEILDTMSDWSGWWAFWEKKMVEEEARELASLPDDDENDGPQSSRGDTEATPTCESPPES